MIRTMESPPILIYDSSSSNLRGIEVANRSSGGRSAVRAVIYGPVKKDKNRSRRKKALGKREQIQNDSNIFECYLSIWVGQQKIGYWERVK